MKNKKGFTLVELLAVIAILAILVLLAMPNILNMFTGAKKKLFVTEAQEIAKSASTEYVRKALSGDKVNKISSKDNTKLNMNGGNSDYYIELDDKGNVTYLEVSSDSFCLQTEKDYKDITDKDIKEGSCDPDYRPDGPRLDKAKFRDFIYENPSITEIYFIVEDIPTNVVTEDLSTTHDNSILAWMDGTKMHVSNAIKGKKVIFPKDSSWMFAIECFLGMCFKEMYGNEPCSANCTDVYFNLTKLNVSNVDTSHVTNMKAMFGGTGNLVETFEIIGLDDWNVSSVKDMSGMFTSSGGGATTFDIGDLSKWDVSNVETMYGMFEEMGYNANNFEIKGLDNWDTSNVKDMSYMFEAAGRYSTIWNIGNIGNWDTSNVENISYMFRAAGCESNTFTLDLSDWDVSNVTNMRATFVQSGYTSNTWSIGDLSKWDTSKVTDMAAMFEAAGRYSTIWNIGNIGNWDTSNVESMAAMLSVTGENANNWYVGDLSDWDTSKVTDMSLMFESAGKSSDSWNIGNISNWDTSKVTNMKDMFMYAGQNATEFDLNISGWDTSKVTDMKDMFTYAGQNATDFTIIIPSTNGNGQDNNSTTIFGKDSSVKYTLTNGREFSFPKNN